MEWALAVAAIAEAAALILALRRPGRSREAEREGELRASWESLARDVRDEFARSRAEAGETARLNREEAGRVLQAQAAALREAVAQQSRLLREGLDSVAASVARSLHEQRTEQAQGFDRLTRADEARTGALREAVERRLQALQENNDRRLEQMRLTVDERLQATLEQRLGDSFRLVSERLELVHRGLGEMQALAGGVDDLRRMMTNVKTRGTWGEIQLGALLEQVLAPDQYAANVAVRPDGAERVDFAVRLPGGEGGASPVWLPIDAKFPLEDYQRLLAAQEAADPAGFEEAGKALERRAREEAAHIRAKYVAPPFTTDFALMFVPTEGLYAELIRRPGLLDRLQRDARIVLAGPTTLAAMLNSLQMGFRTLAIERRSAEVWETLGGVKAEFAKFGEALDKVRKKIEAAGQEFGQVETRTRAINRRLREVEILPADSGTEAAAPD